MILNRLTARAFMAASVFIAINVNAEEPKQDNVPPKGFRSLFNGKDLEG